MDKKDVLIGLLAALFLAIFISPFAPSLPDGLERVAIDKNFIDKEEAPILDAPLPDYAWPNLKDEKVATSIAGAAGTIAVFLLIFAISPAFKKSISRGVERRD